MLKESIRMSWQNICSNKMRTFLTMLGIIIGVTAIIALITTVEGATGEMTSQFAALGAGKVTLTVSGTPVKRGLTSDDVAAISQLENVKGADPSLSFTRAVYAGDSLVKNISVEGHSEMYFADSTSITQGRKLLPLDMDRYQNICIIDEKAKSNLFPNDDCIGKTVVIAGQGFTVVGLQGEEDTDLVSAFNASSSSKGKIYVPYPVAMRVLGNNWVRSLTIYIDDTSKTNETVETLKAHLDELFNYRENAYSVLNLDSLMDTLNTLTGMMTSMLAGIASIALLVGGIGIMNMMLVSVSERTMEIGLRKALGARPILIQMQFLIESVMLSLMGGIVGIILGNIVSIIIAASLNIAFVLNSGAITLAFGFSASVGILFGWAPARKASKLNPIDALRSM